REPGRRATGVREAEQRECGARGRTIPPEPTPAIAVRPDHGPPRRRRSAAPRLTLPAGSSRSLSSRFPGAATGLASGDLQPLAQLRLGDAQVAKDLAARG